jgi:dienelactone hydrolase
MGNSLLPAEVDMVTIRNYRSAAVIAACLLGASLCTEIAGAGGPIYTDAQVVEFESASFTYTPSPFKVKQARKLGKTVEVSIEPSVPLFGYLVKPEGEEPRPAVVLLHTCAGISEHEEMWSRRLVSWGYVVLTADSFTPRGFEYTCDSRGGAHVGPWRRALDAFGAKRFLSTLSFVDSDRIAVMGMSHGGMTVMKTIMQSTSAGLAMKPFQAAIAFYPLCSTTELTNTPTLILTGSKDSWTPAELCEEYIEKLQPGHEISLHVFEGAHHAFDHPNIDTIDAGYIIRSDPEAAARASQLSHDFLREQL